MNIGDFSKKLMGSQPIALMPSRQADKAVETVVVENIVDPEVAESKSKAFYEYQEKPWLTEPGYRDEEGEWWREQGIEPPGSRERYIQFKKSITLIDLDFARINLERFRKELAYTHPELADKNFGFTLDEGASVKIINYNDSLSESDVEILTAKLNQFPNFSSHLQQVAKAMMTLVDHDHETFRRAFRLNLDNFHKVVDFGAVISAGVDNMLKEWVGQVGAKADRRDAPYVSVTT